VAADSTLDDVLVRTEVREALAALPEAQREVIELVFWGGLTRREVADQLQLPLGTVHTRLRLAMEKLREALGRWFGEP
jgi:RNA polymerase sigma-70 factor (ECF subfamily)